jgi:hypothetical protein
MIHVTLLWEASIFVVIIEILIFFVFTYLFMIFLDLVYTSNKFSFFIL